MIVFGCAAVREPVLLLRARCAEAWGNCRLVALINPDNYEPATTATRSGRLNSDFFMALIFIETLGGFEGRRIRFQELIGVGQFENAINHAVVPARRSKPPAVFKREKQLTSFPRPPLSSLVTFEDQR